MNGKLINAQKKIINRFQEWLDATEYVRTHNNGSDPILLKSKETIKNSPYQIAKSKFLSEMNAENKKYLINQTRLKYLKYKTKYLQLKKHIGL